MTKELGDGFKRSVYWDQYQTTSAKVTNKRTNIYGLLNALFQSEEKVATW